MQTYTKILIGMAVGVVVGMVLGPRSPLLPKDTYSVPDPSTVELFVDKGEPGTGFSLPGRPPSLGHKQRHNLRLAIVDTEMAVQRDATGAPQEVPVWSRVRFRFSTEMAIRDSDGKLAQRFGSPAVGQWLEAWLKIENVRVASGGFASRPVAVSGFGDQVISLLSPVGALFMRLIMMVIVPLVFASLLVGVASLGDLRKLGRLGAKTIGLYLATTAVAVTIGLTCANLLSPGRRFMSEVAKTRLQAEFQHVAGDAVKKAADAPPMIDTILEIVPENPIQSLSSGDMLQIIFFALIFGIALTAIEAKDSDRVVRFFDAVQKAMIVVIHGVMAVAPFGVAALVAEVVGTSGLGVLGSLLAYGGTVLLGLILHAAVVYGCLLRFVARVPLGIFIRGARPAQLIAFSTSSSSAALPVTMECAEKKLGASPTVASFVLPLGATVNMDGTALYQGVAAVFIAQVFQMDLSLGAQLGIVLTATVASIGAAGVPGAGMITLALVLTAAGIPPVGVALILGMDRLLDMFRTLINVTGDLTVTSVVARSEGEQLVGQSPARGSSARSNLRT